MKIPYCTFCAQKKGRFDPALIAALNGNTTPIAQLWVFIVGPLAGAALAAVCYNYLSTPDKK